MRTPARPRRGIAGPLKRFAVYDGAALIGVTWATTAAEALAVCRRFTAHRPDFAREEAA